MAAGTPLDAVGATPDFSWCGILALARATAGGARYRCRGQNGGKRVPKDPLKLSLAIGTTPQALPLKNKQVGVDSIDLDIVPNETVFPLFRPMVREQKFDLCEMAIVTYLMAHDRKKPISLVPAIMMAWEQHPQLVCNVSNGKVTPQTIEGKRVGVRSYSQTTGCWNRGFLQNDFGVDLSKIRWVTFEDAHLGEFRDPPFVERASAGKVIRDMLLAGELDCAIIEPRPDPRLADVYPAGAAADWARRNGCSPINHMMCVRTALLDQHPWLAADLWQLVLAGRAAAGLPAEKDRYGIEANHKALSLAATYAHQQGLVSRRYEVEELFHPSTLKVFA
jgi:4,5-dihydroxyphthalate decarboxylase